MDLIYLKDNIIIEIEPPSDEIKKVSGGLANIVDSSLSSITPILTKTCQSIIDSIDTVSVNGKIEKTEIEFGLAFEGEGKVFITRSQLSANLLVRVTIKKDTNGS